ncbi:MAG: HD domain-containing protein [Chloroflexota bacterium]
MFNWLRRKEEAPAVEGPEPSLRDVLLSKQPSDTFLRWLQSGYLQEVLPDLAALHGVSQLPAHKDDAFVHTLKVVDAIEPTPVRRWAALLHDIGKGPAYIETPEGRSRFFDHDRIGTVMVGEIMPAAGENDELTREVQKLVSLHMRPISYNPEWSDSAVRRLREEAADGRGEDGWRDLLALSRADLRGYLPEPIDRGLWVLDSLEERSRRLAEEEEQNERLEVSRPRSPLDGTELVALANMDPGPWVGRVKDYLLGEVVAGRLGQDDKTLAAELALQWIKQHPQS